MGATLASLGQGAVAVACEFFLDRLGDPGVARDVARPRGAGGVNLGEGFSRQPQIDPVEAADGGGFRIGIHGATLAPAWRHVEVLFSCFVLRPVKGCGMTGERIRTIIHLDIGAFYPSVEQPPAVVTSGKSGPLARMCVDCVVHCSAQA